MVCPESANFFYGEYGEDGVSRESMSNPGKPGFSFCFSIQGPFLSYASSVFTVFSVFSVSVREEKFFHTQLRDTKNQFFLIIFLKRGLTKPIFGI